MELSLCLFRAQLPGTASRQLFNTPSSAVETEIERVFFNLKGKELMSYSC